MDRQIRTQGGRKKGPGKKEIRVPDLGAHGDKIFFFSN
jgi:hypothetical protein